MKFLGLASAILLLTGAQESTPRIPEKLPRLNQYLDTLGHDRNFAGDLILEYDGQTLLKRDSEEPFPIASIAEQFSAVAILQLQKSKRLRLDDSICKYIADCPAAWNDIQIVHLLTHSSGLPEISGFPFCGENGPAHASHSAILAALARQPLLFKPGSRFAASQFDYYFVSLVIERASAQSFGDYITEQVIRPIQLHHTSFSDRPWKGSAGANQSANCSQNLKPNSELPIFFTRGILTNSEDLAIWENALVSGRLVSQASLGEMFEPYIEGHGFGWKVQKEFDRKVLLQEDESSAFSVSVRIYPDDKTHVLGVSHTSGVPAPSLTRDVGAILFGRHYPTSLVQTAPPPKP